MEFKEMTGRLKELDDEYKDKGFLDPDDFEEYKELLRGWIK